jgi:hypothetical protein
MDHAYICLSVRHIASKSGTCHSFASGLSCSVAAHGDAEVVDGQRPVEQESSPVPVYSNLLDIAVLVGSPVSCGPLRGVERAAEFAGI